MVKGEIFCDFTEKYHRPKRKTIEVNEGYSESCLKKYQICHAMRMSFVKTSMK